MVSATNNPEEACAPVPRTAAETIYTPVSHRGTGFGAWRVMIEELRVSRELTWRLILRDFSARYRQSVLGYFWVIMPALITVLTFTLLSRSSVLPIKHTSLPYPLFVLLGITVWQLFASGLTGATQCLVNAGSLITKVNFPRETLVLAAMGQSIIEFAFRAVLVAIGFAAYRVMPAWTVVLIPFALLPLCLFTIGLGFLLALTNGITRDAGHMVGFALTFWMLLTPVVYPAQTMGVHATINLINPVAAFVSASHDLATNGKLAMPGAYVVSSIVSLAIFLAGWRIFHLSEPRIAERI